MTPSFRLLVLIIHIYSVNLGGWFVLEPFITPALFQKYPSAVDEWTLSTLMAADTSPGGGLSQIEDHYKTFIVRTKLLFPLWCLTLCIID
jgi:hypothetical protein